MRTDHGNLGRLASCALLVAGCGAVEEPVTEAQLRAEARFVLDTVAAELVRAERDTLFPDPESPTYTESVSYAWTVDEVGEVWGSGELGVEGHVAFLAHGERGARQVLSERVRLLQAGEVLNGVDDNGNGLVDESGLNFTLAGDVVEIRLTLEASGPHGDPLAVTLEERVALAPGRAH